MAQTDQEKLNALKLIIKRGLAPYISEGISSAINNSVQLAFDNGLGDDTETEQIQLKAISKEDQTISTGLEGTVVIPEIIQETNGITSVDGVFTIAKAGFYRAQLQLNFDTGNNTGVETWAEFLNGESWVLLPDSGNVFETGNVSEGNFNIETTLSLNITEAFKLRVKAKVVSGSAILNTSVLSNGVVVPSMTTIIYKINPVVVGISIETNNLTEDLHVGSEADGNSTKFEPDGTVVSEGEAMAWDEISQSFVGKNIYINQGRIDYDYDNLTVNYTTTARYPDEFAGSVKQMAHRRASNTNIRPHVHWMQNSDNNPNILIEYRAYNNGEVAPAWTQKALSQADNLFPFTDVGQQQITEFNIPASVGESLGLSGTFEVKIYRDSQNASNLFPSADTYSGDWEVKYYDIHILVNMFGSRDEFAK
jgi:hypothetical protein